MKTVCYLHTKKFTFSGQEYLVAENGSVKYSIITESDCERMTSVKFVNVKFEAGNKSCGKLLSFNVLQQK
jgi:hypothetical protein